MWGKGIRGQRFSNVVEHGAVSSPFTVPSWRVPSLNLPAVLLPEGGWRGMAVMCQDTGWVPAAGFLPVHKL